MDWNKTKTIFIMVFLILDIFLLYQFIEKRNSSKYDLMSKTSTEDLIKEDDIKYVNMPKESLKEKFLIAKSKVFEKKDIQELQNQKVQILSGGTQIRGIFKNKISLSDKFQSNQLDTYLKGNILNGDQYRFWSYDKTNNVLIYYQYADNKTFFNNSKGKLKLFLNDNREIASYEQTFLEGINEQSNKEKEILPASQAIENLYIDGDIPAKSEVKAELGYYNSLQSSSVSNLLIPTWKITVNDKKDLFVNAFDGEIIELNTEEKILLE
ncbi:two-component system regulatory protein YycI [Actinomycetes bacterium NPDC127524]